jgi:hypothetical protein
MYVVTIASKDGTDPIVNSCGSVTVATPKSSNTLRERWMYTFYYHISNIVPHEENKM